MTAVPVGTAVAAIDPASPDVAVLDRAADVMRKGGVVAFPTETFYGLGALALDARAVRRVFAIKGRPASKPLLVLVDSVAMVETVASGVSASARGLMARHWPGPLTLVLQAAAVPVEITAGTGTIGVRLSPHPVATGLVRRLRAPITAPSANVSGHAPPVSAAEVVRDLGGLVDLVLDGGPTAGGLPSTVVDATADPPRVIRQGAIQL